MKQYKKLILLFLIIVFASCIIAPIKKVPLDFMLEKTGFMADSVDYEDGIYNFGKVMRRVLMVAALIVFLVYRKSLRFGTLISSSLKVKPGFLQAVSIWFFTGGIGATHLLWYWTSFRCVGYSSCIL